MIGHRFTRLVVASALALGVMLPSGAAPAVGNHPTTALLPDLAMLQPDDFRVERKPGGKRWLRFSTTIVNIGEGAFDAYGYERSGGDIGSSSILGVTQRIQNSDGTWSEHGTTADMFYSGDGHDHWHVEGMQDWDLTHEGTPENVLATGAKTGFCFWDNVDLPDFDTPKQYEGTWACHLNAESTQVPMGLAVGWGDKYPWNIAFQYIDITQLPYGEYCLTLEADRDREFVEKTTDNNTTRTLIDIRKGGVTVLATECVADTSAPSAPTGLSATAGDGSVALDWADNNPDEDVAGYHVYRDSGTEPIATVATSAHTDTGLTNEQLYCYEVSAFDASGNESTKTAPECATPRADANEGGSVRIADLAGSANVKGQSGRWEVFVTITVQDGSGLPVGGATVTGDWSGATTGTVSGTTASDGVVTVSTGNLAAGTEVTYTVAGVTAEGLIYDSSQNIESSITVVKP